MFLGSFICVRILGSFVMSEVSVLGMLGLPGAGKTTAAESLSTEVDGVCMLRMSSVASDIFDEVLENGLSWFSEDMLSRFRASEHSLEYFVPDDDTSKELADFAGAVLSVKQDYFSQIAVDRVVKSDCDRWVVDGVRSLGDLEGFDAGADEFKLLYIHTPFSVRYERIVDRGRDSEKDAELEYLVDRDKQELGWGVDAILENRQPDMFYNNFGSETEFSERFVDYVEENELV